MIVSFDYPQLLLFLLFVPVFILAYFFSTLYTKRRSVNFSNFEAISRISGVEFFSKNLFSFYLNVIILVLIVLSLAGTNIVFEAKTSSFSYVFVIDNSRSMMADDFSPNRLTAAKDFAKEVVDGLPIVNIGVVSFSGDAKVIQEMDSSKFKTKLSIDLIDFDNVQGTDVYDALIASNNLFNPIGNKAIILISDGQVNIGDTEKILNYAKTRKIVINALGVGTTGGGKTDFDTISKIDEDFLKALSFNTGGKYFRVNDSSIFDEAAFSLSDNTNKEVSLNMSMYFLIAAILILFVNWILFNFRFETIP